MQSTGVITDIEYCDKYKQERGERAKELFDSYVLIFIDLEDISSDVCTPSKICVYLPQPREQYSPRVSNHPDEKWLRVGDHVSVEFQLWLAPCGRFISPDIYNVCTWTLLKIE